MQPNKDKVVNFIYDKTIRFVIDSKEICIDEIKDYIDIINKNDSLSYVLLKDTYKIKGFILSYILLNYIDSFTSDYNLILQDLNKGTIIFRNKALWEFIDYKDNLLEIKSITKVKNNKDLNNKIPDTFLHNIIISDRNYINNDDYSKSRGSNSQIDMINNQELFKCLNLEKECLLDNLNNEIILITDMNKDDITDLLKNNYLLINDKKFYLIDIIPIGFYSINDNYENMLKSSIHENNLITITNHINQGVRVARNSKKKKKVLFVNRDSYYSLKDDIVEPQLEDILYHKNLCQLMIVNDWKDINKVKKLFDKIDIPNKYILANNYYNESIEVKGINCIDNEIDFYVSNILKSIKNLNIYKNNIELLNKYIICAKSIMNCYCYHYCLPLSVLNADSNIREYLESKIKFIFELHEYLISYSDIEEYLDSILFNLLEIQYCLDLKHHKYNALLNCNLDKKTLIVCKDKYICNLLLNMNEIIDSESTIITYSDLIKAKDLIGPYNQIIYLSIFHSDKFEFIQNTIAPVKKFIISTNEELNSYRKIVNTYKQNIKTLTQNNEFSKVDIKEFDTSSMNRDRYNCDSAIDNNAYDYSDLEEFESTMNFDILSSLNSKYENNHSSIDNICYTENSKIQVCKKLLFENHEYMLIGNNTILYLLIDNDSYKVIHHNLLKTNDTIIAIETSATNTLVSDLFVKYVKSNESLKNHIYIIDIAKNALKKYMENYSFDYNDIALELKNNGFKREPHTIKGWLNSYKTIGFRDSQFYQIIYKITGDNNLKRVLNQCYHAEEFLRNSKTKFRLNILHNLILNLKFDETFNLEQINFLNNEDIEALKDNIDNFIKIRTISDINPINSEANALNVGKVLSIQNQ